MSLSDDPSPRLETIGAGASADGSSSSSSSRAPDARSAPAVTPATRIRTTATSAPRGSLRFLSSSAASGRLHLGLRLVGLGLGGLCGINTGTNGPRDRRPGRNPRGFRLRGALGLLNGGIWSFQPRSGSAHRRQHPRAYRSCLRLRARGLRIDRLLAPEQPPKSLDPRPCHGGKAIRRRMPQRGGAGRTVWPPGQLDTIPVD